MNKFLFPSAVILFNISVLRASLSYFSTYEQPPNIYFWKYPLTPEQFN